MLATNVASIGAAGDRYRAVVLLRAINVVLKLIISCYVVKLGGWLVVLRGPILAAIDGDGRTAVVAIDHPLRIFWINPKRMMIAMGRRQQGQAFATISGTKHSGVEHVDGVDTFRVGEDVGEIPGSLSETLVVIDFCPTIAAIIGAIESAGVLRFDERVHAIGICSGNGYANSAHNAGRQSVPFEMFPG